MDAKEFAVILKEQMELKKMSTRDLALRLGFSTQAVLYVLRAAGQTVSRGTVLVYAEALGVSASVFFTPKEA